MPGMNGAGPLDQGLGSGRGWAFCRRCKSGSKNQGSGRLRGQGLNCRRLGAGRGMRDKTLPPEAMRFAAPGDDN